MAYTRRMHADVSDKELADIKLGQKVQIISEGEVCELREGDSYDLMPCGCPGEKSKDKKKEKMPASITIKVKSTKVRGSSEYDELESEDE